MSIGFPAEDRTGVVWRGPMLHARAPFVKDVRWGKLDYLILDSPRHRRRRAHALAEVRSTGAVIVTRRRKWPFRRLQIGVDVPEVGIVVLGVVENESLLHLRQRNKRHEIFGKGGGQKVAEFRGRPLLGQDSDGSQRARMGGRGHARRAAAPWLGDRKAFVEVAIGRRVGIQRAQHVPVSPLTTTPQRRQGPRTFPSHVDGSGRLVGASGTTIVSALGDVVDDSTSRNSIAREAARGERSFVGHHHDREPCSRRASRTLP